MGVVFRARQRSLNRPVALKMLLAGIAGRRGRRAAVPPGGGGGGQPGPSEHRADLRGGRARGRSYFSMKLIEGGSLAQRLPEFAADHRAAARLMATVARAVHHAHQRGILHRDLKPATSFDGAGPRRQLEPHVTDFGLAKRVEGDSG